MKRAIVFSTSDDTGEIKSLLDTLEISAHHEYVQHRDHPHTRSYLGPGKIEEISKNLQENEFDLIVINGNLKPSQHHFLEMKFQKECMDRTGVILEIFSNHAHTPEAIAQVTLAKLKYEQPFLREWIHKAKRGDRPGFLAGGAYATDVYYEYAKRHARQIELKLRELSKQREITRNKRRSLGYGLVSLAGYTNAGKSALFNKLSKASVEIDNRLFSTLSTTTRKVSGLPDTVLISDTVGFIRDLPPDLIDAFNSTLEEIFQSDMIVVVVDVSESDDQIKMRLRTSLDILCPRIPERRFVVVGNKVDLIDRKRREHVSDVINTITNREEVIFTSASTGEGLDLLVRKIEPVIGRTLEIRATLPIADESLSLLSTIRKIAFVNDTIGDGSIEVFLKCRPADCERISGWIRGIGGSISQVEDGKSENSNTPTRACNGNRGAPLS